MREMWEQRFAAKDYIYGVGPNDYIRRFIDTHPPGKILLPAEGEGRNAVYAAEKGWQVTAFDFSKEARQKALKLASERGVTIEYDIQDIQNPDYPEKSFDAIALIYIHLHTDQRREVHHKLRDFLKPGGYLMLESFSREQLQYGTGGPKNIDMLYDAEELKKDFESLEILELETRVIDLDAGRSHQGRGSVVRMIAQKPDARQG